MASYNAGRSLAHLLTNGAFESMRPDKDGYVTVAQAADQLLTRRSSSGFRCATSDNADAAADSTKASMRQFVERTVATFGLSRPGHLNRREFARMYETFVKRPAQFAQLIGAAADTDAAAAEDKDDESGGPGPGLVPGPPMSHEQLRALVDRVNERLAEEQCSRAKTNNSSAGPSGSGGFVFLGGQQGGSEAGAKPSGKPGKLFQEDLQLD